LVAGAGVLELGALTRRAGLSTGALYHHFGSKAGLLAAVYDDFYSGLQAATADARLPDADWGSRERERTRCFVAYHFENPLAGILLARIASDPQLAELESVYIQTMSANAADNIRHGQDLGQLPAGIDPDSAGAYVIGGLRNGITQQLRATPRSDPDRVAELLWNLTAATLGIR
jgi:AcrR family transcriptional regulator